MSSEFVNLSGFHVRVDHERYSPTIVEALKSASYEVGERNVCTKFFRKGDRVLEVGASIGAVSMVIASIVGPENYIGFEANPEIMSDALANFEKNGMSLSYHNALLRNRLHGGAGSAVPFHISRDIWTSSLTPSSFTVRTVEVPLACFEDEVDSFHANALMLDIEGGEYDLLEYAELSNIEKIFLEVHYWPSRRRADRMLKYLINDGFSIDLDMTFGHNVALRR